MKTYRDFDNYLKNFPDEKGYFGEYGGMILPPELVPALKKLIRHIWKSAITHVL